MIEIGKSILVISLTGIGNTLLFTPALRRLTERYPDAKIDVLVEGGASRDVLETNPDVDDIFNLQAAQKGLSCLNLVRRLRGRHYDRSYTDFPSNRPRFNVFTWMLGASERVIHSYPDCSFPNFTFLQTRTVPAIKGYHDIVQNLRLVAEPVEEAEVSTAQIPRPVLKLTESDREFARGQMGRLRGKDPVIALHPGSSAGRFHMQSGKRYPVAKFAELARLLAETLGATVLVICGPDEPGLKPYFEREAEGVTNGRIYFPDGRIREIAALVEGSDLLISNDSGLMHIAIALKTAVIALFGPTNVERTGPVWEDCRILTGDNYSPHRCFPYPFESTWSATSCGDIDCWEGITPQKVVRAAERMLDRVDFLPRGDAS